MAQVRSALGVLASSSDWRLVLASRLYRSPPWGISDQPEFINAVAALETGLAPEQLLLALQDVERAHGRRRDGPRWGPRTLDLDLLLMDDRVIRSDRLSLPHPRMHERAFVLLPLRELAPDLIVPGQGRLDALLDSLDTRACRLAI